MDNNTQIAPVAEQTQAPVQTVLSQGMPLANWMDPQAFNQLARVSAALSKSSLVPQSYQGKPEDCMIAMDMANRIGTNPLMVMQNLYVVKGKPSWSGQACGAFIKNCGLFENVDHVRTGTRGSDDRGCYYTAIDKRTGKRVDGVEVTVAMAKAEGWYGSNPKWRNMTELMLMYRAASFFAREFCPDVLMGCQTVEEVEDVSGGNTAASLTDSVNAAMKEGK